MIKSLKLANFRKFETFKLEFENNFVIISGDNTKGKSTILEAIYLITNGITPWGEYDDEFNDLQKEEDKHFRIEVISEDGKTYSYFRDNNTRVLNLDGKKVSSRKFFEDISSVIFSPERIDLLMISSSKRREFVDNILLKIDIEFGELHTKYLKALRQRNAYLKRLSKDFYEFGIIKSDDTQLKYWTEQIAKLGSKIITQRVDVLNQLNGDITLEYKPSITLNLFEDLSDLDSIYNILREQLKDGIKRDIATGVTNIGPHRDDWSIYQGKDVRRFGSRGEKRVAVGRLILQSLELISEKRGNRPILLLDDITSELDRKNTEISLSNKVIDKQQTILTVIDINHIPEKLKSSSQIIDLNTL